MFKDIWDKIIDILNGEGMTAAELEKALDKRAEGKGLNWRVSVVDFLKLIGADSSGENRAALMSELGLPPGSGAEENENLRLKLFERIREAGGNIPSDLTD